MAGKRFTCIGFVFCLLCVSFTIAGTFLETKTEYEKLVTAYGLENSSEAYHIIPPRLDNSAPVVVTVGFEMYSLTSYDAVAGVMDIVGSVYFSWNEVIATVKSLTFDSAAVPSIMVDYQKVWTPVIVMVNSANSIDRIADSSYRVRVNLTSFEALWNPRAILSSYCPPDVSMFPFDKQTCDFTFTNWYHDKDTVELRVDQSEWKLDKFKQNGVWSVQSTSSRAYREGNYYYTTFTVKFQRESAYYTLNILFPILLLSILSGFIFYLPADSGERMGFGMTCFLSFVVLLQTMMQFLPEASKPMSILCYYVIIMMMFSAILSIFTVVLLKVYETDEDDPQPVPRWLKKFIAVIKCIRVRKMGCFKKRKVSHKDRQNSIAGMSTDIELDMANVSTINVGASNISRQSTRMSTKSSDQSETDSELAALDEIDWQSVGQILDYFFLVVFWTIQILMIFIFIIPLAAST